MKLNLNISENNYSYLRSFNLRILNAASASARNELSEEDSLKILKFLSIRNPNHAISPILIQAGTGLISHSAFKKTEVQKKIVEAFEEITNLNPEPQILHFNTHEREQLAKFNWTEPFFNQKEKDKNTFGEAGTLVLGSEVPEKAEAELKQSLAFIKKHWPEFETLLNLLCSKICLVYSDSFQSGVSLNCFGAMFLSIRPRNKFIEVLEMLVHEAAHLQLLAHEQSCEFLLNDRTRASSPLREGARPLRGILHGAFSLARMCEVLKLHASVFSEESDAADRLKMQINRFDEALKTLNELGDFTSEGKFLLNSLNEYSAQLKK